MGAFDDPDPPPPLAPLARVPFECPVRGIGASGLDINFVNEGDEAALVKDVFNPADTNAVAVWVNGALVGHLPRDVAKRFHPEEWTATVKTVYEKWGRKVGVRLQMQPIRRGSSEQGT